MSFMFNSQQRRARSCAVHGGVLRVKFNSKLLADERSSATVNECLAEMLEGSVSFFERW